MVKPLGSSLFAWMHDDTYNRGYTYSIQQLEVVRKDWSSGRV